MDIFKCERFNDLNDELAIVKVDIKQQKTGWVRSLYHMQEHAYELGYEQALKDREDKNEN